MWDNILFYALRSKVSYHLKEEFSGSVGNRWEWAVLLGSKSTKSCKKKKKKKELRNWQYEKVRTIKKRKKESNN